MLLILDEGRALAKEAKGLASVIGLVYAEDEESAIVTAIEEHNVRPADQKRLIAGRAECRPLYWQKC